MDKTRWNALRPGAWASAALPMGLLVALLSGPLQGCADTAQASHGAGAASAGAAAGSADGEAPALSFPSPGRGEAEAPRRPASGAAVEHRGTGSMGPSTQPARTSPSSGAQRSAPGSPTQASARDSALESAVERAVARALGKARKSTSNQVHGNNVVVSVSAVDLASGLEVCARSASRPLTPASNLKLFTVASAALLLGMDASFETRFFVRGAVAGGTLDGDLVVLAGGDPLHRREGDGSLDPWLDPLAQGLGSAGIQRVTGSLVLDEGTWLEPGPGPEWPSKNQHWTQYCAFAAGLTACGSSLRATVTARSGSGKAPATLRPRYHGLKERIGVRVDSKNAVSVGATATTVTVRGTLPAKASPLVTEFSHPDPVALFGHAISGGLRDRGISFGAAPRKERGASEGLGAPVYTLRTPIASCFDAILLDSNNPVADQVYLTLGARLGSGGTRDASATVVRRALRELGLDTTGYVQVDGSGLSKANRVSARQFAGLVAAIAKRPDTLRAFDDLPVAGRTGSLKKRMRGSSAQDRVRAKTGWVAGASSLSGIAETLGGRRLAFSIVVSYPRVGGLNTSAWKPMQDEICERLVEWRPGQGFDARVR